MSHIDYERLSKIVGELETLMPEGEAFARIERRRTRYGVVANQTACLRMGAEMLKAAAVQQNPADQQARRTRNNRPRPVARRKLREFFDGDSAVQIERIERHDILPSAPTPIFSKKNFVNAMMVGMILAPLTILGGITASIAAVDTYVIPNLGDKALAAAIQMPAADVADEASASTDAQ